MKGKDNRLFLVLGVFFIANALIAEFVGVKIFSLEKSMGTEAFSFTFFGHTNSLNLTAGVVLWPVVFVMTDIVNDYFGVRGVRTLTFLAVAVIIYAFAMVYFAMNLTPADFWRIDAETGLDRDAAFRSVFGQGLWIIGGSLTAFVIGQLADAFIFYRIKRWLGSRRIWLRATLSTLVSQWIDSFVVLFIAFYLGPQGWPLSLVLAVGLVNYLYKFVVALAMIPILYGVHALIDGYLGHEMAQGMLNRAAKDDKNL